MDECLFDNGNCSDNCVNDIPFYHCECNHGDELDFTGLNCIHNVECFGKGVNCSCLQGYQDPSGKALNCTGNTDFTIALCLNLVLYMFHSDIDECEEGSFECTENSHCINLPGSYMCVCDYGYRNGTNCCKTIIFSDTATVPLKVLYSLKKNRL